MISTAGEATLSVADPSPANAGKLVNGTFTLPQALKASATSPLGSSPAVGTVGASQTALLIYSGPVSNDPLTLTFTQVIGANDALRTGTYGKTLTFTLSTAAP